MTRTASSTGRGRSRRRQRIFRNVTLATLALILVAGGGLWWHKQQGADPRKLLSRATAAYQAADYAAATIDLRAVLAAEGDNAEARELLGLSYLKQGDATGALRELNKARGQGVETQELSLGMVRAQILLGKFLVCLSQFAGAHA